VYNTYTLFSNTTYGVAPDADQMGTAQLLDTRGTRIRSAYIENNVIHFGINATRQSKCEIYYGSISGLANPAFAAATGGYVSIDSFDIGYPALAYGGHTSSTGTTSSVLFFNFTSPNHYPGNASVFIDTNGVVSAPTINKNGFTWLQQMTNPERWGDYAEIAPKHDNPGEYWCGGYLGYNNSAHYHGTWISQIFVNGAAPIAVDPILETPSATLDVYPNPTAETIFLKMQISSTAIYSASVFDMNGAQVKLLFNDKLKAGEAILRFNAESLAAGTYLVVVANENGAIMREKFVVQ
jgi:Secretion system C-terminal sorting domain